MRSTQDIAVRTVRYLAKTYNTGESMERFTPRAMSLVRLYNEEAWRRCLDAKEPLRMAALGNLMRTMRSFEMSTFQEYTFLGVYSGFTKENVLNILTKIMKKGGG